MPVRMTREGRADTREAKRTEQDNQKSKSGKAAGFSSTSQKGNIVHGKLKSQKELKKITGSEDYKKSDYEGKTKMLNVATAKKGLASRTHGSDKPNKEIGKQSFKKNFSFSGKQMSDHYKARKSRTQSVSRMNPVPYLTGGQAKIAAKAPPPNVINEKDFAVLRAEKAKGRGMGLQDEKVKPGKVKPVKAVLGIAAMGLMGAKYLKDKNKKATPMIGGAAELMKKKKELLGKKAGGVMKARVGKSIKTGRISDMSFDEKMKRVESGQINKKTGKFTSMNAMRDAKGFQKGESAADFNKRRKKIMEAAKIAKSTRVGKMLLPVVGAAIAAKTYLNSKMKKDKNKKTLKDFREQKKPGVPSEKTKTINSALNKLKAKKMGGGMMKKYSKGGGFDSGTPGKVRDAVNNRVRVGSKIVGNRLTKRDLDKLVEIGIPKVKKIVTSKKYMGGGMMQKPMGYNKGVMVKARGCKLGRTRPTKIT